MLIQVLILLAGLLLILFGANWLVDGSSSIAKKTGLSEFVIGLTIVGIGTSSPEMVVSFISSIQGKADMAIGNIVGSNIFNTMAILGTDQPAHHHKGQSQERHTFKYYSDCTSDHSRTQSYIIWNRR